MASKDKPKKKPDKMFKVTTCASSYTHYWVEAESAEAAEAKYGDFTTLKDDPEYGEADEEVIGVEELNVEELKVIYAILENKHRRLRNLGYSSLTDAEWRKLKTCKNTL